jgi:hypothetical protein
VDIALDLEDCKIVEIVEIVVVATFGAFLGQECGLSMDSVLPRASTPCHNSMYLPSLLVPAALVETA